MEFKELFENFPQSGLVLAIGVRPQRLAPMEKLSKVLALKDKGLSGDRYNNRGGNRQVTLIQAEHMIALASFLGLEKIDPVEARRNIIVKGINLLALKQKRFRIGEAILEYSGECHPCSRMEKIFGHGAYNAMRGHGGITAKVVTEGIIKIGDTVEALIESNSNSTFS
jgi:MOSC domain-containing protein YiiM